MDDAFREIEPRAGKAAGPIDHRIPAFALPLGQFLRAFNEPEGTAYAYIGALGQGSELFDVPGMIDKITVRQVNQRINELLTPNNYAASVLLPQ